MVDDDGHGVADGAAGEALIRAPGMFRGYLNRPEATAEAMRDGWYHTGDLVRQDERGFVYFLGRKKDIVRRSGENIAAAEVEAVLRLAPEGEGFGRHPGAGRDPRRGGQGLRPAGRRRDARRSAARGDRAALRGAARARSRCRATSSTGPATFRGRRR